MNIIIISLFIAAYAVLFLTDVSFPLASSILLSSLLGLYILYKLGIVN